MHELGIADEIVKIAVQEASRCRGSMVTSIHCRIGVLRQVEPELLIEAFGVARAGTVADQADLVIDSAPLACRCPQCEASFRSTTVESVCPTCGASIVSFDGGMDLDVTSLTIESSTDPSVRPAVLR